MYLNPAECLDFNSYTTSSIIKSAYPVTSIFGHSSLTWVSNFTPESLTKDTIQSSKCFPTENTLNVRSSKSLSGFTPSLSRYAPVRQDPSLEGVQLVTALSFRSEDILSLTN